MIVAVVVGLLGLSRLAAVEDVGDVLQIPPTGAVRAEVLADGTPVLASHLGDGTMLIVEALAPDVAGPVGAVVGWCPRTQQFIAPHHGLLWDERGRHYPIGILGRLGPATLGEVGGTPEDDLRTRAVRRVEGHEDADDPVLVGPRVDVLRSRGAARPAPDVTRGSRPPEWCRVGPEVFVRLHEPDPVPPERQLVTHSGFAGPLDLDRDGFQVVTGTVVVPAGGPAVYCADPVEGSPPGCGDDAVAVGGLDDVDVGAAWTALEGPVLLGVADGRITGAAVLPESRWRGASGVGTQTASAGLVQFSLLGGQLRLDDLRTADGTEVCWASSTRPPVDVDATIDVAGATTAEELAQLRPPDGQPLPVRLEFDAGTCRVLSVTDAA